MRAPWAKGTHHCQDQRNPRRGRTDRAHPQPRTRHTSTNAGRKCANFRGNREDLSVKPGVLLFNFGGPERLRNVKPFLYRLFSDPEIVRVKWAPARKALAYLIATFRHKTSE